MCLKGMRVNEKNKVNKKRKQSQIPLLHSCITNTKRMIILPRMKIKQRN
jgi:hypothetical protein